MKVQISTYEKTKIELQLSGKSIIGNIEMNFNIQEYTNKLTELEKKYIEQVKESKTKIIESEKKWNETNAEIQKAKIVEKELRDEIYKLEQVIKTKDEANVRYQNLAREANKKIADNEKKFMDMRQKDNLKLMCLNQTNIELNTIIEQLKAKLEQAKHNNKNSGSIICEKDEEIERLKELNQKANDNIKLLKDNFDLKISLLESQKTSLGNSLEQKISELQDLKTKYFEVENNIQKEKCLEEQLNEKSTIIASFNLVNDKYKTNNELLKDKNAHYELEINKIGRASCRERVSSPV